MTSNAHSRRGGILRGVAWMAAALGAFLLVVALFAYRGGKIQQELHETSNRLKSKLPEIKEKFPNLPDIPDLPKLPTPPADSTEGTAESNRTDHTEKPGATKKTTAAKITEPVEKPRPAEAAREEYTVEDPPPVAKAHHKVGKGETLYSLAETYYEDGKLWKLIAKANNLNKPADLREGMVVVIPGRQTAASP